MEHAELLHLFLSTVCLELVSSAITVFLSGVRKQTLRADVQSVFLVLTKSSSMACVVRRSVLKDTISTCQLAIAILQSSARREGLSTEVGVLLFPTIAKA